MVQSFKCINTPNYVWMRNIEIAGYSTFTIGADLQANRISSKWNTTKPRVNTSLLFDDPGPGDMPVVYLERVSYHIESLIT